MVSEIVTHFSPKKCNALTLRKFYHITHTEKCTLHLQELVHVFELKDLGVILRCRAKTRSTHFGESGECKHNNWVDS